MKWSVLVAVVCGSATVCCLGSPSLDFWHSGNLESIHGRMDNRDPPAPGAALWISGLESGVPGPVDITATDPIRTIRIPAPGALLLASLGAAAVGWLRTRRSL